MGGTLDNGIYLPDQGERNCYNGLKNNWDTLDNLIETVQALSSAGLTREIVNSLPTDNIKTNVIYMLRNSQQSGDLYDEYMYINNAWEPIGTSATEMDNYYTKSETNALPAVASGITASKVTGYDTHVANTDVHVTTAEKTVWNGKQNALDTAQTAAVNSGVNATKVTGYDTHVSNTDIHVTAADKTAWNGKQDGLSQTQLNAVNSGVTDTKVTGYDTHVGNSSAHVSSSDRTAWNGKQDALTQTQLDNIATIPDKANSADLATVATSGSYTDLINAPTIPTVNNATLTIQKNGTDVATFTANASSNVTANLSIPVNTSDLNNDAGFLTQHNPIDNELSATSENALQNKVVKSELDGKAPLVHTHAASDITSGTFNIARIPNLDASKITSGTIDIARLPKGSLERLIKVANQSARYALTTDDVQLGDTVQQLDTGVMYVVTDETKLDSADGYTEFTAGSASSVPWTGVTGKPSDYPPSSHTHTKSQITDFPALATVATSGEYSDLNNIPASFTPSSHTHGNISSDGKVGTTANLPLITGTGGAVQAGAFGNQANTFCEGNDSRLSDARTPVAHTHTKADITDLFNSANTWSDINIYKREICVSGDRNAYIAPMWAGVVSGIAFLTMDASKQFVFGQRTTDANNRYVYDATKGYLVIKSGETGGNNHVDVIPNGTDTRLGDSTHKWNNFWANNINSVPTDTVEWHNSHYRGINLISTGHFANMAALLTAIRAQNWSDIYIGDYVELTFTYEGASRTVKFYVGEIDKFYKVGNKSLETHHLVMVTGDLGINQVMNDSDTTAGGYVGSKAHTVTLPALYAILNPLFNNAILTHREHLSNTVLSAQTVSLSLDDGNGAVTYSCNNFPVYSSGDPNTPGCVTAGNWYDCNLVLMSEIEMFGSNRFSSSGIDDTMCPEGQIAAFKYNHNLQTLNCTINTWLRNVNSASRFCYCIRHGYSYRYGATNTAIRLRPRFLIG